MTHKAFVFCAAVLAAILAVPIGLSASTSAVVPITAEITKQMNEGLGASPARTCAGTLFAAHEYLVSKHQMEGENNERRE